MDKIVARFARMSVEDIAAQPVGKWADADLLDVLEDLAEAEPVEAIWERERAVRDLILHSPDHSELVEYSDIYWAQALYLASVGEMDAAIATAYAGLVYELQHDMAGNARFWQMEIAEVLVKGGDTSVGIAQFARLIRREPTDLHGYYRLARGLVDVELYDLAWAALDAVSPLMDEEADEEDVYWLGTVEEQIGDDRPEDHTDDLSAIDPHALADLRAAFATSQTQQADESDYLSPLDRLLTVEASGVYDLHAEIQAQGDVLVPELVCMAWDQNLYESGNAGPSHALEILRALREQRPAHFVRIDRWLDQAKGDWRGLLYKRFGLVGGYTQAELRDWAADPASSWYVRSAAGEALVERAGRFPEERAEIVAFLTGLLDRPGNDANVEEETFTSTVIDSLCDLGAAESYPAIERAYAQDRVDLMMVDLDDVQREFGLPITAPVYPKDGLVLNLTCKRCGRCRPHFVQHVTIDVGTLRRQQDGQITRYDPHVMDREIVCPKCGAVDNYELGAIDALRLMIPLSGAESFRAALEGEDITSLFRPHPRVTRFESQVFDRPMHPLEGLAEYRRRIQQDPKDTDLRLRMGLMLRLLHRFEEGLETVREAHEMEPDNPELMTFRAMLEHDFGDKALAKKLYQRAQPLLAKAIRRSPELIDTMGMAAAGLTALARGEPSPWQPEEQVREDPPAPPRRSQPQPGSRTGKKAKKKRRR